MGPRWCCNVTSSINQQQTQQYAVKIYQVISVFQNFKNLFKKKQNSEKHFFFIQKNNKIPKSMIIIIVYYLCDVHNEIISFFIIFN